MPNPYWCDPALIKFKISPHFDLAEAQGDDWDIERRYPLEPNVKHRAVWQRYSEGRRWEDTDLFRINYTRRFEGRGIVRGEATIEALAKQYYDRVDGLFAALKRDGFQIGPKTPLPVLLIGRGGEIFIGNQGNHRLAMAQVLGLPKIAGKVLCRHPLSQR